MSAGGRPCRVCGEPAPRIYATGPACPAHTPAALAGRPESMPGPDHLPHPHAVPEVPAPRYFPDDAAVPCVHCSRDCAPIALDLFGVVEHVACIPPPRRILRAWAEHDAATRAQENVA